MVISLLTNEGRNPQPAGAGAGGSFGGSGWEGRGWGAPMGQELQGQGLKSSQAITDTRRMEKSDRREQVVTGMGAPKSSR